MPVENDIIPRVTPGSFRRPQARTPRARWRYSILLIVLTLSVAGCARNAKKDDPSGLTVEGVNLEVRMSSNVFIPPVAPPIPETQRRVYVVGTNTSTIQSANDRLHPLLLQRLAERGYRLTNNPADAHYMLLYNVLYVGKEVQDLSTVTALATGVGGAAVAATVGRRNEVIQNAGIGGLVGTVTGAVTGHYFETNTYELVVDLQIRERQPAIPPPLPPAEAYRLAADRAFRDVNTVLGLSETHIESAPLIDRHTPASPDSWDLYNSQVVGFASKLRLTFKEAEPLLFQAMAREISGIFWDLNRLPGSAAPTTPGRS